MKHPNLNVVGCGRLGQALTKLFVDAQLVGEARICNRSVESGQRAVQAIGAGKVYRSYGEMPSSALWLIGSGDQQIPEVAERLAESGAFEKPSVVFHGSGVITSEVLAPLRSRGCFVASVHPVRSFANADLATRAFAGTFCGIEGDEGAMEVLRDLFTLVGGEVFSLSTEAKMVCHAGHVFASNYLVALLKVARDLYAAAGIPDHIAWRLMAPLVQGTVDNVMRLGPTKALTGPIARGEGAVVARQLGKVAEESPSFGDLYSQLGLVALEIAGSQGLSAEQSESIRRVLSPKD